MKRRSDSGPGDSQSGQLLSEAKKFQLKKRLGQHFLVDDQALNRIADELNLDVGDHVIEIGPGIGFLTRLLAARGAQVTAVELDRECTGYLEQLNLKQVDIRHGDFLAFDLCAMDFFSNSRGNSTDGGPSANSTSGKELKVVGNVPYQITGRIVAHLLGEVERPSSWFSQIKSIVLTVQYEVARRITAAPGDSEFGRLTLLVNNYCDATMPLVIPADSFYTPPKVTSAVVTLTPRANPLVSPKDPALMRKIIEAGFRQRRKMFRNSLSFLKLPQVVIDKTFADLRFDPQVRPERLSLQQFAMLADALSSQINDNAHG